MDLRPQLQPPPTQGDKTEKKSSDSVHWVHHGSFWDFRVVLSVIGSLALVVSTFSSARRSDLSRWISERTVGSKTFAIANLPLEANKPIKIGLDYWNFRKDSGIERLRVQPSQTLWLPRQRSIFLSGESRWSQSAASYFLVRTTTLCATFLRFPTPYSPMFSGKSHFSISTETSDTKTSSGSTTGRTFVCATRFPTPVSFIARRSMMWIRS